MRSSSVRSIRSAIIREIGNENVLESITEKSTPSPAGKPTHTKESILALLEGNRPATTTEENDSSSPHDSGRHSGSGGSRASLNGDVGGREEPDPDRWRRPVSMTPRPGDSRPSSGKVVPAGEEKKDAGTPPLKKNFEDLFSLPNSRAASRAVNGSASKSGTASKRESPEPPRFLFGASENSMPASRPRSITKEESPRELSSAVDLFQDFEDQSMKSDPKRVTFGDFFGYRRNESREGSLKGNPEAEKGDKEQEQKEGEKEKEEEEKVEKKEDEGEKEEEGKKEEEGEKEKEEKKEEGEKEEEEKKDEEKKEEEQEKEEIKEGEEAKEEMKEEEKTEKEEIKEEGDKAEKEERKMEEEEEKKEEEDEKKSVKGEEKEEEDEKKSVKGEEKEEEDEHDEKDSTATQSPHRSFAPEGVAAVPTGVAAVAADGPPLKSKTSARRYPGTERRRLRRPRQQKPILMRGEPGETPESAKEPKGEEKTTPKKLRHYKPPKYVLLRKPKADTEPKEEEGDHNNNKKNSIFTRKPRTRHRVGPSIFGRTSDKGEEPAKEEGEEEDSKETSGSQRRSVRRTRLVRRSHPKEEPVPGAWNAPSSQSNKSNDSEQTSAIASEDESSSKNLRRQEEKRRKKKRGSLSEEHGGDSGRKTMESGMHEKELLSEVRNLLHEVKKQREDFRLEIQKLSHDISKTASSKGPCCSGRRHRQGENGDSGFRRTSEELERSALGTPPREPERILRDSRPSSNGKEKEEAEEDKLGVSGNDGRHDGYQRKTYSRGGHPRRRKVFSESG